MRFFRTALRTSSGQSGIAGGGRGGLELGNPKTLECKAAGEQVGKEGEAGGHELEKSSVSLTPQSRPAGQGRLGTATETISRAAERDRAFGQHI
jgi:hypothetical protein